MNGNIINIVYVSDNVVLILTDSTYLYRTADGGDTWTVVSTGVMQIYPNADNSAVYVTQKNNTSSSIWVFSPSDASMKLKQSVAPNSISLYLKPHHSLPSLVAVSMSNYMLSISDDAFDTWYEIDNDVYFGDWGFNGSYYYNSYGSLKVIKNVRIAPTTLMQVNHGILAVGDLLFIAVPSSTGALQLMSSRNRGEGPWIAAFFPDAIQEYQYTILDVSAGSVIVAVVDDDSGLTAKIYMSDAADAKFTRVLSSVRRKANGHTEIKLTSVKGVMLANQYTSNLASVQTVISYDNGGKWQLVPAPMPCTGKNCGMMLHISSKADNEMWGPVVVRRSAVGLILATGTIGPYVSNVGPNMTSTFFSRTAGLEWEQVTTHSSIYEYGDHGALMVLADNFSPTTTLSYSWNEGMNLVDCTFTKSAITVVDIVGSPNATSQSFFVYGTRGDNTTALVHLDFTGLHERVCQDPTDYEDWSVMGDKCLLGQQITYTRRKQTAECYNPLDYDTEIKSNVCGCIAEDYECDFCYEEVDGSCKLTCASPQTDKCTGQADHFYLTRGYRLVPGTVCDPDKGLNLLPKRISCAKNSGIAKGAIAAIVILFVAALIVGVVFLLKNERTRRWLEDRFSFLRGKQNNAWADSIEYLDSDTEADAPILNDEAIVHFSENSPAVK
eukprot:Phypoly_transcript_04283.p1 GENE.Phypoly_transcript_04283~~Phypoly_transcript_04283.p1  ORF type:complete len:716 (+),score=73.77 Phypoly_transcript_04283:153-2150(+)